MFSWHSSHLVKLLSQQNDFLLVRESHVQARRNGIDEVDATLCGLLDELGQVSSLLQCIQLSPIGSVLFIIFGGIQIGIHPPF